MSIRIFVIVCLVMVGSADPALACDCTIYPFVPNPPCFRTCTKKLSFDKYIDLSAISGLDEGVAKAITKIRFSSGRDKIDFSGINKKGDLEDAAARAEINAKGKIDWREDDGR